MQKEISTLVREGTLTPISALTDIEEDDKSEYMEGIVIPHIPDTLTHRYATHPSKSAKVEARARHSQYIVFPTSFLFPKVVRIVSMIRTQS